MKTEMKFSVEDFEGLYPFEKDILIGLHIKELERKNKKTNNVDDIE